jgi:hypothetical protein
VKLPDNFRLEIIGSSDDESDREFTFTDYSKGSVAFGYAASLKIIQGALSEFEMANLSALFPKECAAFTPRPSHPWHIILTILGVLVVVILLAVRAFRGVVYKRQ